MPLQEIIFAGFSPSDRVSWYLRSGPDTERSGAATSFQEYLETVHTASEASLIIVLPGEQFIAREIRSPARSRAHLIQTAQFLLEDDLAGDVTQLHLAVFESNDSSKKYIAGIDHDILLQWTSICAEFDVQPDIITADFLCISNQEEPENTATVLSLPAIGHGTSAGGSRHIFSFYKEGFVTDSTLESMITPPLLDKHEIRSVKHYDFGQNAILQSNDLSVEYENISTETELYRLFSDSIVQKLPPNLLQGEFTSDADWGVILKPWKLTAALMVAAAGILLATVFYEGWKVNRQANHIYDEARERFEQSYPDVAVRDLERQAKNRVKTDSISRTDFMVLVSVLGEEIEKNQYTELTNIRYNASGILISDIVFPDTQELDDLKSSLGKRGIEVEEGARLTPVGNKYLGQLSLRVRP